MNFDKFVEEYTQTHTKPDKKHVMVPTTLKMLGSLKNKTVIDVGCGDGFFTKLFAKEAKFVYGIDISKKMLELAEPADNIKYSFGDMRSYDYPKADAIFAPFVLNYVKRENLGVLFGRINSALNKGGIFGSIVDMPERTYVDGKEFGFVKQIDALREGNKIEVELYNQDKLLTNFQTIYHTKDTFQDLLFRNCFSSLEWHKPIVDAEGKKKYQSYFWDEYTSKAGIAFFVAKKE